MDPNLLILAGVVLGFLIALVGTVMFFVAAFRQSVLWGLGSIFIPFVSLIFTIAHWSEAKRGFLISSLGTAMICVAVFCSPSFRKDFAKKYSLFDSVEAKHEKARDLTAEIAQKREMLDQLVSQAAAAGANLARDFKELEAKRKALKSSDEAAIARFNEAAAVYQARNSQAKVLQSEMATVQADLDGLLAERSKLQAAGGGQVARAGTGSGQGIVMYTTSSCGACKAAKSYLAQRGLRYEELDVEHSPSARQEFERLGGRGVPLILVGSKRLEGFSPSALEAML